MMGSLQAIGVVLLVATVPLLIWMMANPLREGPVLTCFLCALALGVLGAGLVGYIP